MKIDISLFKKPIKFKDILELQKVIDDNYIKKENFKNGFVSMSLIKNIIEKRYANVRPSNLNKILENLFFNVCIYRYIKDELSYFKLTYLIEKISEKYTDSFDREINKKLCKLISTRKPEDLLLSIIISSYATFNEENIEHVRNSITRLDLNSIHKFISFDHIEKRNPIIFNEILNRLKNLILLLPANEKIKLFDNLPKSILLNERFYDSIITFYLSFNFDGNNYISLRKISDLYGKYISPIQDNLNQGQFEKIFNKILEEYRWSEDQKPKGWTVYYRNEVNKLLFNKYKEKFPQSNQYSDKDQAVICTDAS